MSRLIRKYKNREGLTLLEVGIVLAVFALIIIGVLTAVSVVNASGRNSRAATQIGNIRSAIGKFTAGGPVFQAAIKSPGGMVLVPATGLSRWTQLVGYLPGSLQAVIDPQAMRGGSTAMLTGANPWQGGYNLLTVQGGTLTSALNAGDSVTDFHYGIEVTSVTAGELPVVANQIRTAGIGDAVVTEGAMGTSFTVVYSN